MTPRRFDWGLRCRGPALDGWPAAERAAALELLRQDGEARLRLAEALAADAEADGSAGEAECAALLRMQGVVRRALAPTPPVLRGLGAGAMAVCLLAGLYLGSATSEPAAGMAPMMEATVLAALDP